MKKNQQNLIYFLLLLPTSNGLFSVIVLSHSACQADAYQWLTTFRQKGNDRKPFGSMRLIDVRHTARQVYFERNFEEKKAKQKLGVQFVPFDLILLLIAIAVKMWVK